MANIILFDADVRNQLLPLTYSRPVGDLRIGILTIREKWEQHLRMPTSFLTQDYLQPLYPLSYSDHNLLINGCVLPTPGVVALVLNLSPGEAYLKDGELIAACLDRAAVKALAEDKDFGNIEAFELGDQPLLRISRPADIFSLNDVALREDFALLTAGRKSEEISSTNTVIGPRENLFVEPGVRIEACILNVENGPVYISKNAVILEGCLMRGPLAIGEDCVLKMGAKIYGATTFGPGCKVGGRN